jgi:hypothetical protein
MKTLFAILFCLVAMTQHSFAQTKADAWRKNIVFDTLAHDFGNIAQGKEVSFEFRFTNHTDQPIIIDNVRTTCGCTAAEWQESPVMPNTTTTLPVSYDALKTGYFEKTIKVWLKHYPKPITLTISGEVVEK